MKALSLDNVVTASTNWVDLIGAQAARHGDREAYTFLDENGRESGSLTFPELDRRARAVADLLTDRVKYGDRALLLYPAGLDYVVAFFGCLYAGVIGVPLFTPARNRSGQLDTIASDCAAAIVLTTRDIAAALDSQGDEFSFAHLPRSATDTVPSGPAHTADPVGVEADTIAYLQYTSGSTSTPKGVVVDHAMAIRQCMELAHSWQVDSDSVVVSWLPHFHDFGQVSSVLMPVYAGCRAVRMAPSTFVKNPIRWLDAVTAYRGTHSGAPNFAYDLCVDKTTAQQRAALDLSSWRLVCNGAEPVRGATLDRFQATFAPHGLPETALTAGYGLAEATLKVTCGTPDQSRIAVVFDPQALGRRRAEPAAGPDGVELVGVGTTVLDTEIAVVEPESGRRVHEGEVGEVWVTGPSVSRGYWDRPEETERTFGARITGASGDTRWLRTGDLGFRYAGELFICGRLKNLMIVNGVNYYLEDIEATVVAADDALRAGGVLAFGVADGDRERLVLVAEYRADGDPAPDRLVTAMRDAVARVHGIAPAAIVLIAPGTVPRTTSGKLRRQQCRADFLADRLTETHRWTDATPTAEPESATAAGHSTGMPSMSDVVREGLLAQVREWASAALGPDAPPLDPGRTLAEHGLGSVDQMNLHERLERWAGRQFAPELIWDAESVEGMVRAIADALTRAAEPAEARV